MIQIDVDLLYSVSVSRRAKNPQSDRLFASKMLRLEFVAFLQYLQIRYPVFDLELASLLASQHCFMNVFCLRLCTRKAWPIQITPRCFLIATRNSRQLTS